MSVAWLAFPSIDAAIALVPKLVELGAQAAELIVVPAQAKTFGFLMT